MIASIGDQEYSNENSATIHNHHLEMCVCAYKRSDVHDWLKETTDVTHRCAYLYIQNL